MLRWGRCELTVTSRHLFSANVGGVLSSGSASMAPSVSSFATRDAEEDHGYAIGAARKPTPTQSFSV